MSIDLFNEKLRNGDYEIYEVTRNSYTSSVWQTFIRYCEKGTDKVVPVVVCKHCGRRVKHVKGDSTSNLRRHPCCRKDATNEVTQETLSSPSTVEKKIKIDDSIRKEILQGCIKFSTMDVRPFQAVNGVGFQELAKCLVEAGTKIQSTNFDVSDILPDPRTISRNLRKSHKELLAEFVNEIAPVIERGECAATTDMWQDGVKKRHFMALTVHYIDDCWKLHSRVLCVINTPTVDEDGNEQKQTAENLRRALEGRLEEIGLGDALYKLKYVTDQGSNIIKMLKEGIRINCSAHLLNVVLKNAFADKNLNGHADKIVETISKCKSLVEYFKRTGKQEVLTKNLHQECSTRWNTMYDLLKSVNINYDDISSCLMKCGEEGRIAGLSKYYIERLIILLKDFKTATLHLEADQSPTINYVVVAIQKLKSNIRDFIKMERKPQLKYVAEQCEKFLFEKFIFNDYQKIAAFLSPEFKQLNYLTKEEAKDVRKMVESELRTLKLLLHDNNSTDGDDSHPEHPTSSESSSENQPKLSLQQKMGEYYSKYKDSAYKSTVKKESEEIRQYLQKVVQNNVDVLEFWHQNSVDFPLLSKLARSILAMPASSAASERCFSVAGRILEERRNALSSECLDACIFLHSSKTST